jgi:hypothetical protein
MAASPQVKLRISFGVQICCTKSSLKSLVPLLFDCKTKEQFTLYLLIRKFVEFVAGRLTSLNATHSSNNFFPNQCSLVGNLLRESSTCSGSSKCLFGCKCDVTVLSDESMPKNNSEELTMQCQGILQGIKAAQVQPFVSSH